MSRRSRVEALKNEPKLVDEPYRSSEGYAHEEDGRSKVDETVEQEHVEEDSGSGYTDRVEALKENPKLVDEQYRSSDGYALEKGEDSRNLKETVEEELGSSSRVEAIKENPKIVDEKYRGSDGYSLDSEEFQDAEKPGETGRVAEIKADPEVVQSVGYAL